MKYHDGNKLGHFEKGKMFNLKSGRQGKYEEKQ